MTFLELQQEVVDRLNLDADLSNGDTPTPFTQADIQSFINKGYNDFLYLTKIYQKTTTVSASSSNYYELDKTYNRILSIMYNQKTLEIQETGAMGDKLGRADWRDYETDDEDPKYAIWENMSTSDTMAFRIYPQPSSLSDIYITYIPYLSLSADGDTTVLPTNADEGIILFALKEAFKQLGAYQDRTRVREYENEYARYISYYMFNAFTDKKEVAPMRRGEANG